MSRKWTYEIGYGYESILRNGVMVNKEQAVRALNNYEARIATLEKALNIDTDLTIAELRVELRDATARIAELKDFINQLIEAGDALVGDCELNWKHNHIPDCPPANNWNTIVKDWKEG